MVIESREKSVEVPFTCILIGVEEMKSRSGENENYL
jgi:hypothetical protein